MWDEPVAVSSRAEVAPGPDGGRVMLARQRQALILERVREDGGVRVADLVRELGVSDMTIRRDLEILDDRGLLEKVHGGATALSEGSLAEPTFITKSGRQQAEKDAIAAAAAELVEPGMAIAISAGTTTHALARRLVDTPRITVVTNSIPVADVLYHGGRPDQAIILTGGVRTPSEALVGPFAVAALRTVHVDLVFVGVHGMDPHSGFTCPNLLEADTDRALIDVGASAGGRRRPHEVGRDRDQLDRGARPDRRPHHRSWSRRGVSPDARRPRPPADRRRPGRDAGA